MARRITIIDARSLRVLQRKILTVVGIGSTRSPPIGNVENLKRRSVSGGLSEWAPAESATTEPADDRPASMPLRSPGSAEPTARWHMVRTLKSAASRLPDP